MAISNYYLTKKRVNERVFIISKIGTLIIPQQTDQNSKVSLETLLSGVPDYFGRKKIASGGDLSHYSSASLY